MHYSALFPAAKAQLQVSAPALAAAILAVVIAIISMGANTANDKHSDPSVIVIRNVTPVDAHNGAQLVQDVLIRNGIIEKLGQDLVAPKTATVIDGQGRFLAPGLWDMHVHLSADPRLSTSMPALFLDYGITSVRDTGGSLEALEPIVTAMRAPGAQAPRVFFAGPLLDGEPVVYSGDGQAAIGTGVTSTQQARDRVKMLADAGVSFIKIYEMVSPEVFAALADEALRQGLPIAAHVPLSMLASQAAPRVQSLEHLRNIELDCAHGADDLLEKRREALRTHPNAQGMALRSSIHDQQRDLAIANEDPTRCDRVLNSLKSSIQVPTARLNAMTQYPPFLRVDWASALAALPATIQQEWKKAPDYMDPTSYRLQGEWTLQMISRLAARDISIGAGTDTPIGWAIPGYSLHNELEILVAAGLSTQSALGAATLVPARFFNLQQQAGRVAEGYQADLLLLEGNPLEAIENTRRIAMVIARGEIVRGGT